MFNFGDDFVTGNYRIPWLIWIQLLILFLLILLLCSFSFLAIEEFSDSTTITTTSAPAAVKDGFSTFGKETQKGKMLLQNIDDCYDPSSPASSSVEVEGSQSRRREIVSGTSRRVSESPHITKTESSESESEDTDFSILENQHHPCYLFRLAREALLKCLGLEALLKRERRKEE